jgi:hypothetical protein
MKGINILLLISIASMICVGCSKDNNKSLIEGTWVAVQASQAENANEEIGHYNKLYITSNEIDFRNSNIQIENDKTVKENLNAEKKYKFEWISKDQLKIDNKIYDIELSKLEMTLRDDNIEIHIKKNSKIRSLGNSKMSSASHNIISTHRSLAAPRSARSDRQEVDSADTSAPTNASRPLPLVA